jgi:hypothetical protein
MPTYENLRAKLDPKIKGTDMAARLTNLRKGLQSGYRTVKDNLQKSDSNNKKYYDRQSTVWNFQTGDIVFLHNPTRTSKLSKNVRPIWAGPYRIRKRTGNLNYVIEDQE